MVIIKEGPQKVKIGPKSDKWPEFKKSEHTLAREKLELEIGNEIKLLIKALRIFIEKNRTIRI